MPKPLHDEIVSAAKGHTAKHHELVQAAAERAFVAGAYWILDKLPTHSAKKIGKTLQQEICSEMRMEYGLLIPKQTVTRLINRYGTNKILLIKYLRTHYSHRKIPETR